MAIRTELNLRLPNSPGTLANVCQLLSDERVNILAMALEAGGHLRLLVDNHVHAGAVLREHHHAVSEREVLVLTSANVPGGAAGPLRLVADSGINIEYAYGSTPETGASTVAIVLGVDDALRASAAAGV